MPASAVLNPLMDEVRALADSKGGVIAQCEWGKGNPKESVEAVFESWL